MKNTSKIEILKNDSEFSDLLFLVNSYPLVIKNKNDLTKAIELYTKLTEDVYENLGSEMAIKKAEEYIEILSNNIDEFERGVNPSNNNSPIEIIEFLIKQNGLKKKDLAEEFGSAPMVSDILNGKREISAKIAKALAKRFKVSPALFF